MQLFCVGRSESGTVLTHERIHASRRLTGTEAELCTLSILLRARGAGDGWGAGGVDCVDNVGGSALEIS